MERSFAPSPIRSERHSLIGCKPQNCKRLSNSSCEGFRHCERRTGTLKYLLMSSVIALLILFSTGSMALAATGHRSQVSASHSPLSAQLPLHTGGCNSHAHAGPGNLFDVGICIDDRNTGNTVFPDVYINSTPPVLGQIDCVMYMEVWNGNHKEFQDDGHTCYRGYYDTNYTYTVPRGSCESLHSSAWMLYYETFYRLGDSPSYTYCNG